MNIKIPWSKVAAHNGLWILKRCRPYCAASKIQGSDLLKKTFFFFFVALMIHSIVSSALAARKYWR